VSCLFIEPNRKSPLQHFDRKSIYKALSDRWPLSFVAGPTLISQIHLAGVTPFNLRLFFRFFTIKGGGKEHIENCWEGLCQAWSNVSLPDCGTFLTNLTYPLQTRTTMCKMSAWTVSVKRALNNISRMFELCELSRFTNVQLNSKKGPLFNIT